MQKIYPCLWQNGTAEEAAALYMKAFKNSRILQTTHYPEGAPMPKGSVMTIHFLLNEQEFMILNGGPWEPYTGALSLVANCDTQEELDHVWDTLTADGGQAVQCGWLKDKYGVSWQVVPTLLGKFITDTDPVRTQRVMTALWKMVKLDIATLQAAYDGK
ncbi:MAG: 3-demethylubiquinone-9 3-methyltransferase [Bacteroidetes bacterium]|nr:3-demethylubiquinone-9 3-methyltransferase [Bacteroidota bacterium]